MASTLHIVGSARKALYLDPRWQKKRLEILSRDEFACQSCGSKDATLHVHHLYYADDVEGPWDYPDKALVTLCHSCHEVEGAERRPQVNSLVLYLAEAGFNTSEKIDEFLCFIDNMRCGSSDPYDRQTAINFLLSYWEKNGAYPEGGKA